MSKSIHKRFIRAWQLRFRDQCDSKISQVWRKRDIKGFLRETGIVSADSLIYETAEDLASVDFHGERKGWTPEFSAFFDRNRAQYIKLATAAATSTSDDDLSEIVETEISYWGS